jgi:putative transposase
MLVSIPPKLSVSQFMGYLKGKSSLMIFDRHANLKYKYATDNFGVKDNMLILWEEIKRL